MLLIINIGAHTLSSSPAADLITKTNFGNGLEGNLQFFNIEFMNYSVYQEITLEPGCYVVVPCTYDPGQEAMFQLNFYSSESPIVVETIKEDKVLHIKGEWKDKTAAGCLNYSTWRYNPQFLLTLSNPIKVRIQLDQIPSDSLKFIGFYIVRGQGNVFTFQNLSHCI
jgi:hypothetical protein